MFEIASFARRPRHLRHLARSLHEKVWWSRSRLLQTWRIEIAGAPDLPAPGLHSFADTALASLAPRFIQLIRRGEEFPFTKIFRGSLVRSRLSHIKFARGYSRASEVSLSRLRRDVIIDAIRIGAQVRMQDVVLLSFHGQAFAVTSF
jgi:hypothetical protein